MFETLKSFVTFLVLVAIGCMFWFALAASGQQPTRQDLERMQRYERMNEVNDNFEQRLRHEERMRSLDQRPNPMDLPICPASPTGDCLYRGEEYFR